MCMGELNKQTLHTHVMCLHIYFCIILQLPKCVGGNLVFKESKQKFFWRLFDPPPPKKKTSSKGGGVWKTSEQTGTPNESLLKVK